MSRQDRRIRCFLFRDRFGRKGICDLQVLEPGGGRVVVIATERPDNPGPSITNAAEYVASDVCRYLDINPRQLVWIEHYGYAPSAGPSQARTFDLVSFASVDPNRHPAFRQPSWRVMGDADWRALGLRPRRPVHYPPRKEV